ncbi:hypothetical protein SAMN06295943_2935 [Agreia sp. VKM Ac-1783]|nr:hypothetical protein SAMN06295943_2935 [Agreia sp. VKM Ac-1783]
MSSPRVGRGWVFGLWALGSCSGLALLWQVFDVYFNLGSQPVVPSTSDIARHDLTAILCVGSVIAALVISITRRSVWLVVLSGILVVVALGGSAVFSVPAGRWFPPEPTSEPLSPYYKPCYSGSGDCN